MKICKILCLLFFIVLLGCKQNTSLSISYYKDADKQIELAAIELQRYIYMRSGQLIPIHMIEKEKDKTENTILLTVENKNELLNPDFKTEQDYYLLSKPKENSLFIIGSSPIGTLYGAYQYIETALGIEFELQGDIIPDEQIADIPLTGFDKKYSPSFKLRGIQPFHDFPEGPDYWTMEDYQAIVTQLAKMRMNFIGFHTYPEKEPFGGWDRAEPNVWIGLPDEFNSDGTVNAAYPVLHANTNDSTWEYFPVMTSKYSFGANQLYDNDVFGTDFMKNTSKWPHTDEENIHIFNSMGKILNNTFSWAKDLGISSCLGTEIALTIPNQVKDRIRSQGKDPASREARKEVYKGIFSRIKATHPLDYYWFWTPEGWTWEGENKIQVEAVEADFAIAQEALQEVKADFQLATCGWVLGPAHDRTAFDKLLPKLWPFSCINREQGFTPVETGFKDMEGRPKWQISWIEDDPALTIPQLWAGRVRKDAYDAYRYGCDGFMGIHWRTMGLSPIFKSLTDAGWNAASFDEKLNDKDRDYPVNDLYKDWAEAWFGKEAANAIAEIFIEKDGGHLYEKGVNARTGKLPRPAEWGFKGPGTVVVNHRPWDEVKKEYAFIDKLAECKDLVIGKGSSERFEYWMNTFLYMRTMGEIGCMLGGIEKSLSEAEKDKSKIQKTLKIRSTLADKWGEMVTYLLETVNTKGEMGTISNLEQHNLAAAEVLTKYDKKLEHLSQSEISPLEFSKDYQGKNRLVVTTRQSILRENEPLRLQAAVLSNHNIESVKVYYRKFGETKYNSFDLKSIGGNVYENYLPAIATGNEGFEYYYEAKLQDQTLTYPVTSPEINLSIVYW